MGVKPFALRHIDSVQDRAVLALDAHDSTLPLAFSQHQHAAADQVSRGDSPGPLRQRRSFT